MPPEEVTVNFDLINHDYAQFIKDLREKLSNYKNSSSILERPVLPLQRQPKAPARWIHIKLVGTQNEKTTLAIRDDNVYLICFMAGDGTWYEFGSEEKGGRMMEGTIFLECSEKYRDLLLSTSPVSTAINVVDDEEVTSNVINEKESEEVPSNSKRKIEYEQGSRNSKSKNKVEEVTSHIDEDWEVCKTDSVDISTSKERDVDNRKIQEALASLELGKSSAVKAVGILSRYNQQNVGGVIDPSTKRALVHLIIMICEATRMIPFFNTVLEGWNNDPIPSHIFEHGRDYMWNWGKMSHELREWDNTIPKKAVLEKCFPSKLVKIGITCADEAIAVVHMILNTGLTSKKKIKQPKSTPAEPGDGSGNRPEPPSTGDGGDNKTKPAGGGPSNVRQGRGPRTWQVRGFNHRIFGRPMVQVLSVRGYYPYLVGTITVFDGKRGQIIFKSEQRTTTTLSSSEHATSGLVLTGPYRGISAEGSFLIEVDGKDTADSYSQLGGEIFWDCYEEDDVYDKVLIKTMNNIRTNKFFATVHYAAFSDAIEATVEVKLNLHRRDSIITHVYGKITAHFPALGDDDASFMLLFNRPADEKVKVVPSAGQEVHLLSRSVLAVPWIQTSLTGLLIHVNLTAFLNDGADNKVSRKKEFFFDRYTGEIRPPFDYTEQIQVKITSPGFSHAFIH